MKRNYKNIFLLSLSLACDNSVKILAFTTMPLLAIHVSGDPSLYSLPFTAVHFVALLFTLPLSIGMERFGRKAVFISAICFALVGSFIIIEGIRQNSFPLIVAGLGLAGIQMAAGLYYRFAAIELSPKGHESKGISMVLAGGVLAALFAPGFGIALKEDGFANVFKGLAALQIAMLVFIALIRFPKQEATKTTLQDFKNLLGKRSLYPPILAGVLCYNVMTFVMVASPGAMHHSGIDYEGVSLVIQWHMLGMFVPSFFTGTFIERWGEKKTLFLGGFLTLCSISVSVMGDGLSYYWAGLFLLGLGWNLAYVAATSLFSKTYKPHEMPAAQGINEVAILGTNTMSTTLAGFLVAHLGWVMVNWLMIPLTLGIIILSFYLGKSKVIA